MESDDIYFLFLVIPFVTFRQFFDIEFGDFFERKSEFVSTGGNIPENIAEFVF